MKTCCKCKQDLPRSAYYKDSSRLDGLEYRCKSCKRTPTPRPKKTKEERAAYLAQYYQDNKVRKNSQKVESRNRHTRQVPTDQSLMEKSAIRALYFISNVLSNSCGEGFHIDHIHPVSKGGLHEFDNLRILSAVENLKKGNKIVK